MSEPQAASPGHEPSSPTVGEMLREARARRQLSAADVARHLRLSLRQVEALERNDFASLPGNTFVRGFIRNYARLTQIDAAPLLAAYEAAQPQATSGKPAPRAPGIDISPRPSRRWLIYLAGAFVVFVGVPLAIYALLQDDGRSLPRAAPVPPTAFAPLPSGRGKGEVPLPSTPPLPAETSPPTRVASQGAEQPLPTATLHFSFDEDAWVEVRDGQGRKLIAQLNRKGNEQTLTGQGPFSVVVGNAAHVRLTYNGKPVDLAPYVKVNVARLTLE
ncbi:RodZ domain-containing protein [Thiobacter aerophilum]|uniref:RodZ domain-containing protein n=1 Tax=Thiobacter aerophilum TaxID=3121275 RepID=A0ABV0EG30_9BURK